MATITINADINFVSIAQVIGIQLLPAKRLALSFQYDGEGETQ